jgi:hypothetical protein
MVNLINTIKAFVLCVFTTGLYNLYASTTDYQQQLASEGQDIGKIEAMMHYSTLADVWSRTLSGWIPLFLICFVSCLLFLLWLELPDESD